MHAFEIDLDGCRYTGLWEAGAYDRLSVRSDFGTTYAYLDGRDPETLAHSLLAQLVRRDQRRAG
ncbi:hypothetical protein [Caulobacter sp.]|uniref:hypothetical protein n=1 Tax=Caulobacter sp. TaxID=78 RepID=UPI001B04523D|nr:hypothetical protein [Caulobacter sp.]MBO9545808.1 hypothetical protein [Caulobacter sp.]